MLRAIAEVIFLFLFVVCMYPRTIYDKYFCKDRYGSARRCGKAVQWALSTMTKIAGIELEVRGEENIPKGEAVLFVGNHRSYFDIVSVYKLLPVPVGFVAKVEMRKIPIMSAVMERMGCLFLARDDLKQGLKTILTAVEHIKSGISVFIYPEGTRGRSEDIYELQDFHEGSFKVAQKTGCRIVPVATYGADAVLEKHFPHVRPAKVVISFGEPVAYKDIPEDYRKKSGTYFKNVISDMLKDIDKEIKNGE